MMARNIDEKQRIRAAAESILGSSSSHHALLSNECSLNTVMSDIIPPSDVVTGLRPGGRMSVVRRFFCLFVTFDLLFTILMWLICIMLISDDVFKMMSEQIVHYNIHTSLFDIVMAAAARFVVLLLFYALLYVNHWCIIALSTAGTCCFLIAKVFLYNWTHADSPVFQVLLIITSFVISWGEAWFLDFRVIPQEVLAQDIIHGRGIANERSPLLAPYLQGLNIRPDDNPDSVRNFYSPMESLAGSDGDDDDDDEQRPTGSKQREEAAKRQSLAEETMKTARRTLASEGWRREKEVAGVTIDSQPRIKGGKIFRLEGELAILPEKLLHLLFNELDTYPKWNPTLTVARRLEVVDERTDITYQVMAEGGGGLVAPRDFVTLRHWELEGNTYILSCVSTCHPAAPPTPRPIRAEQGPSCWILEPAETEGHTHVLWLLDTELHGWFPQSLLDQTFAIGMLQWMSHLRKYIAVRESLPSMKCTHLESSVSCIRKA